VFIVFVGNILDAIDFQGRENLLKGLPIKVGSQIKPRGNRKDFKRNFAIFYFETYFLKSIILYSERYFFVDISSVPQRLLYLPLIPPVINGTVHFRKGFILKMSIMDFHCTCPFFLHRHTFVYRRDVRSNQLI